MENKKAIPSSEEEKYRSSLALTHVWFIDSEIIQSSILDIWFSNSDKQ